MQPGDIPAVVDLHLVAFLDYFMTSLGRRFLAAFYRQARRSHRWRSVITSKCLVLRYLRTSEAGLSPDCADRGAPARNRISQGACAATADG